ncbi:MAG TPA: DNA polymerase III subunit gamma/tau, partial [Piscirickettsiaceae bacterium]|nr:DNA polymerase III subunit gamma/tau [Piscirickettsiaceae bacterium]
MQSLALARKWRPKTFSEVIGQPHVVEALTHALAQQRLHHAYLFAGTRGVGKTTLGRIFAKALNCQRGITPEPCGQCESCRAIDAGRFVDLLEIDAASRTKVEDTRELLDNVQFLPTAGRFKVYLIDEVHMLSTHSFNALLKTLEEPPEHVKFILATTDPHKLPITVLSRCLKFNLLRLMPSTIEAHLRRVAEAEAIEVEPAALRLIAYHADGSVRDALSLLDQAMAQSGGQIREQNVRTMLGLTAEAQLAALLQALVDEDPDALSETLTQLASQGVDYGLLLDALVQQFHLISLLQLLGQAAPDQDVRLAQRFVDAISPERVQLCYQTGLLGQKDLQWAPDARTAFEMTVLRMLAFEPLQSGENPARG